MPTPIEIAHLTLRQRCTGLGIPTLAIDGAGALVPGPHATLADRLVSTAAFVDPLLAAASLWAGQPAPGVAELFTGCHAAPIPVEGPCLTCHGARESLAPELRQALARRYPEDAAVGYAVGDLRGLVWAEVDVP